MRSPGGASFGPCGASPLALYPRGLFTLIGLVCTLFGCDRSQATITGPTGGAPSNPLPAPAVEVLPRVDQPFSWDAYQGFTAFALGHPGQTDEDVKRLYAEAMSHGWNTARICAETEFWPGDAGYPVKPRDPESLETLLDQVARIPGAQVILVANCTLKGPVPIPEQIQWVGQVAEVASRLNNVALQVVNEFDNCSGRGWGPHCPDKQDVRAMIELAKQKGVQYVTSDDSLCLGPDTSKTYTFRLANIGAHPPDFHPCREDLRGRPWDPDERFLRRVAQFNGMFVISEPVAWMDYSGECAGLRTCDKDRIDRAIAACAAVPECRWTYHSENLLAGESPTYWPEAR